MVKTEKIAVNKQDLPRLTAEMLGHINEPASPETVQMYKKTSTIIYHSLYALFDQPHDVIEDVIANTWIKALKFRGSINNPNTTVGWMKQIAIRTMQDFLRSAYHKRHILVPDFSGSGSPLDQDRGPLEGLIAQEDMMLVHECIENLPEPERLAFILKAQRMHCTDAMLAEELQWPMGTFKTRYRTAKMKLTAMIAERERQKAGQAFSNSENIDGVPSGA